MAYTQNPHLPKVRRDAVRFVKQEDWPIRKVARYFGVHASTVMRWCRKDAAYGEHEIPTRSSKPRSHPHALSRRMVNCIIRERHETGRCAAIIHASLSQRGIVVSLSSVKRVLDRAQMTKKRSPWKAAHDPTPRPVPKAAGDLVEIDTIQVRAGRNRLYCYTLIDLHSRWSFVQATPRIGAAQSVAFLNAALRAAPFPFTMLQTDHGSEFQKMFRHRIAKLGLAHRYIRVRQSNDNAHVERFNRTLQEECLRKVPCDLRAYQKALPTYLKYYNGKRLHMGLNFKTPLQVLPRY